MKPLLWLLKWILKAAIFFALFAFALNNQQDATVRFFFGTQWRLPMVLVVLMAFALGLVMGVLGMLPLWWGRRSPRVRGDAATPPDGLTQPAPLAPTLAANPPQDRAHGL